MSAGGGIIPTISIVFIVITLIITIIAPIVVWIVFAKKFKGITPAIIAGALGFYIPQILIRFTLLQLISMAPWYQSFIQSSPALYAIGLGLSAALFETVGRLVVFAVMKSRLSYQFGLGAGFGHGGIEAVYLVGLTYINNLVIAAVINSSGLEGIAGITGDTAMAQGLIDTFVATEPSMFLIAGFERIFAVLFHIAMSLIICYGFTAKKLPICIAIVMIAHTFIDSVSVLMTLNGIDIIYVELMMLFMALISVAVIVKIKNKFMAIDILPDETSIAISEGY